MTGVGAEDKAQTVNESKPRPYAPSWVDRLTTWVARLPGPSWSYYLGIGLVVFLLQTAALWGEGALPINNSVHRVHAFLAGAIAFFLVLFHHLDERAGVALAVLRPALKATEQEYDQLHFRLTTLPARATLLASLVALVFNALLETIGEHYHLDPLNPFPISGHLFRLVYLLLWGIFGAFLYHTVHQLRLINRIYTQHTHINLFRMKPLYALSNLAALTAGGLSVIPYGFLLIVIGTEAIKQQPLVLSFYIFLTLLAFATFIWPQMGVHRLQVEEKERLLYEANRRFEATIADLHQRIDSGQLEGIGTLNTVLGSLELERNALKRIGTWPWEPEVVRLLVTALALPLGLWIIQFVLQRVLGS
jgi:hypothetical protein